MAYLTQAALEVAVGGPAKLVELTDDNEDGAPDAAVVAQIIAGADGYVNSYVGKRYLVPLAAPPQTILDVVAAEGARRARSRRNAPTPGDMDAAERDDKWLTAVSKGEVTLGIDPAPTKSSLVVDKVGERDSVRTTTRERTKGGIW